MAASAPTPMQAGQQYTDLQGTIYVPTTSDDPNLGRLPVAVASARHGAFLVACDAARMTEDRYFQYQLVGTTLWAQQTFAPLSFKFPV